MDLGSWLSLMDGSTGVSAAVYGVAVLLTGRATRGDRRAFRQLPDVGRNYLCFGLALALLASAGFFNEHDQPVLALAAGTGAFAPGGLAIVRYRPRRRSPR